MTSLEVSHTRSVEIRPCKSWQGLRINQDMQKTGTELKFSREWAGLSAETVAERTKFKLYRILALEEGDFDSLPHGSQLDAIVRAYANEVGIDPEPMVERVRAERGIRPGDELVMAHEPVDFERRRDDLPATTDAAPAVAPAARSVEPSHRTLVLSALALLALLGWGSYLLEATGAVKRDVPGKIYAALSGRLGSQTSPARLDPARVAPQAATPAAQIAPGPAIVAATMEPERERPTAPSQNITGAWRLATQVESSNYARYRGLLLGYELQLNQDGDRITGVGRKIAENGSGIYSRGQTPIAISGAVDGDRLMLTFVEGGAKRTSRGAFVLQQAQDGTLRGRFTSNAAGSSGTAEARRME